MGKRRGFPEGRLAMDTAVEILGLSLMVVGLLIITVSVGGMLGFVPPPPWWTDARRSPGDHG